METLFSKSAYSATALQKAAYAVAATLSVSISENRDNFIVESQQVSSEQPPPDISKFLQLANDYALREKLAAQTEPLRNLVLAHAYSKTQFVQT